MEPNSPGWYGDEPEKIPPLQTHGVHDSEWVPPVSKSRFVSYQKRDEDWMKFFGLGSFRDVLRPIYDVRTRTGGTLVGYTCYDPSDEKSKRTSDIATYSALPVCDLMKYGYHRARPVHYQTINISSTVFTVGNGLDSEAFRCWMVEGSDARILLDSEFITLTGPDRMIDFIAEMRRKQRIEYIAKMAAETNPREFKREWLGTWSDPREESEKKPDTPKRHRDMSFGE